LREDDRVRVWQGRTEGLRGQQIGLIGQQAVQRGQLRGKIGVCGGVEIQRNEPGFHAEVS
jgi:hypothetical protein